MNKYFSYFAGVWLLLGSISPSAEILFSDNFEYEVNRGQTGASDIFSSQGGWTWAKTEPEWRGAGGYVYTVSSIPGYTGQFPGHNSSRVLAMEFLPATLGQQTDAYLARTGDNHADVLPSNVWLQFWVYPQRYGDQWSRFTRGKFLYPSITGFYPAATSTGLDWYVIFSEDSTAPWFEARPEGALTLTVDSGWGVGNFSGPYPRGHGSWDAHKLGHNVQRGLGTIQPNAWTLVRMHFDTSGESPLAPAGQSVWRMWLSADGSNFTQVVNWIGGVTPNFDWPRANTQGGHRALKLGTTVDNHDAWLYFDDFVIATTEDSLPMYDYYVGAPSPSAPRPPAGVIVE